MKFNLKLRLLGKFTFVHMLWAKNLEFFAMAAILEAMSIGCIITEFPNSRHSPLYGKIIGWFGALFFGACILGKIYYTLSAAFHGRNVVEITSEGLYNRNTFIPWKNINSMFCNKYGVVIKARGKKRPKNKILRYFSDMNERANKGQYFIYKYDYAGYTSELIENCEPYIEKAKEEREARRKAREARKRKKANQSGNT